MAQHYRELAFTDGLKAIQEQRGSRKAYGAGIEPSPPDLLGEDEASFLSQRDSFYLASTSETGWPYVQHRGGPPGFLKMLDPHTIGFADFRGSRQYISLGNLQHDDRVAIIAMDYLNRARLKLLGRARIVMAADDPALIDRLAVPGYAARIEQAMLITVEGFDWNCPQHITPRVTAPEVERVIAPLQAHIAELEAELAALRG